MDTYKIFKGCCIAAIVIGGLSCLVCLIILAVMFLATSGMDDYLKGGITMIAALVLAFPAAAGLISVFAGKAGLDSDPERCKKLSTVSLVIMILSLFSAIRADRNVFFPLIETVFYGVFTYLAHTEAY
ncbi:MAG: hypothetical protein J5722_09995 [Oscillospiraceae bacterium]|nr:hypothetical protein [Oscillospiraceae bacterium]